MQISGWALRTEWYLTCFRANITRGGIKAGMEGRAMLRSRAGEAAVAQQHTACRSEGCWERRALGLQRATRLPRRRPADLVAVGRGQTACLRYPRPTDAMDGGAGRQCSAGHPLPLFHTRTEVHDSAQESQQSQSRAQPKPHFPEVATPIPTGHCPQHSDESRPPFSAQLHTHRCMKLMVRHFYLDDPQTPGSLFYSPFWLPLSGPTK